MANFDEFYSLFPKNIQDKGNYFEKIFCPWFLKHDLQLSSNISKIWVWENFPHRWRDKECGIDLVFQDNNDRYWAVQAKCYDPKYYITKNDIDSFLSESNREIIHGRLLIATTNLIGENARQVLEGQEKKVFCFLRKDFQKSQIIFPSSTEKLVDIEYKKIAKPFLCQEKAINKSVNYLKNRKKGKLIMACGSGKTLTSLWIKEKIQAQKTLFLVPSLYLVNQVLKEWVNNKKDPFEWICVCSDHSVSNDKKKGLKIQNSTDISTPVTSDIKEIKEFLRRDTNQVIFSTYQSSKLIVEAQKDSTLPMFDITFADESHRCAGDVKKVFGNVVDEEKIKSNNRIFMTATPINLSEKQKEKALENDIETYSMDDENIFGEEIFRITFREAINNKPKLLTDYQVVVIGVDDQSDISDQILKRKLLTTDGKEEFDAEELANHIALAKSLEKYDLKNLITFHSRVDSAKEFAKQHSKVLDWLNQNNFLTKETVCDHINGSMTISERDEKLEKLRGKNNKTRTIITNAKCLTEGVDIPSLDGIAFIDPKSSFVDIIQAIGRVIRLDPGKEVGTILVPIIINDLEFLDEKILISRFKYIFEIINALRVHDEYLAYEIDQLRIELGKRKKKRKKSIFEILNIVIPKKVSDKFSNSIETLLIKRTSNTWFEFYGQLEEIYFEKGDVWEIPDKSLRGWCIRQRSLYFKKILTNEQINLLNKLNFSWDPIRDLWFRQYKKLSEFYKLNGHSVPGEEEVSKDLYGWVLRQRAVFIEKKLESEKVNLLNDINFIWNIKEYYWNENFNELEKFYKKHGHSDMTMESSKVGAWASRQRARYKNNQMSKEEYTKLQSIKFKFDLIEEIWISKFKKLKKYFEINGHSNITKNEDKELRNFVGIQRGKYKDKKLSQEKINLLESVNFQFDKYEEEWMRQYNLLKEFTKLNGICNPTSEEQELVVFCSIQRSAQKNNKLSNKRFKLLQEINFIWDIPNYIWEHNIEKYKKFLEQDEVSINNWDPALAAWIITKKRQIKENKLDHEKVKELYELGISLVSDDDRRWEENYNLLKKNKSIHGDANVKRSHELGTWLTRQRTLYFEGKLLKERENRLRSLNIIWDPISKQWDEKFDELKQFFMKNGHSNYARDESPLSDWIGNQRQYFKKGSISEERIIKLRSINFIFDPFEHAWNKRYEELIQFGEENGHLNIKLRESALGFWITKQRQLFKKNKLSDQKIDLLEKVEFWVWSQK